MTDQYRGPNPNRELRRAEAREWAEKARARLKPKGTRTRAPKPVLPASEPASDTDVF